MGPKKQSSSSAVAAQRRPQANNEAALKADCKSAYMEIQKGSVSRAQKLVTSLFARHGQEVAVIHHIQGTIHTELANPLSDSRLKFKRPENAAESHRRAAMLSPNSVEFALSHALALFDVGRANGDCKQYEASIEECNRGLAIENPSDPLEDNLRLDPNDPTNLTAEERIANVKKDLEFLKTNCWTMIVFARLKATTDPETQTSETVAEDLRLEGMISFFDSMSVEIRRVSMERNAKADESRLQRLRSSWCSLKEQLKRKFLEVRTNQLELYMESSCLGLEMLEDALAFVQERNGWRFWECVKCKERFRDSEGFNGHFANAHAMRLPPNIEDYLPITMDKKTAEQLLNRCAWKPVDLRAALKMLSADPSFRLNDDGTWPKKWPSFRSSDLEDLLSHIHGALRQLMQRGFLTSIHVDLVQKYAEKALMETLPSTNRRRSLLSRARSLLEESGVLKTLQCVCFLRVTELKELNLFLQSLLAVIGCPPTSTVDRDDLRLRERVRYLSEPSRLVLVGMSLERELDEPDEFPDELPANDAILSWLFEEPAVIIEKLERYRPLCEARKHSLTQFVESQRLLESGIIWRPALGWFMTALVSLEETCKEEDRRRQQVTTFRSQAYAFMRNARTILSAAMDIAENSSLLEVGIPGFRNPASHIRELFDQLESIRHVKGLQTAFRELYRFLPIFFRYLLYSCYRKLCRTEAVILQSLETVCQQRQNLASLCAEDHRTTVVPLLKSFLRQRLEDLAG